MLALFIAVILAYLIGSLSSAVIVAFCMKLPDPRTQGSHNPGATNMLRIGGKTAAIITLAGDLLKGFIPVLIAKWLHLDVLIVALVALAAFLGHLYPLFFKFKGGKGVATLLGCLLAFSLPAACAWMATWLFVAILSRYSSLAALIASVLAPLYVWFYADEFAYVIAVALMAIMLIVRHRRNIANLIAGKESKIGEKKRV